MIEVSWGAVSGATDYLLQWSLNSSFRGPTTRAVRTGGATSYEFTLLTEIAMGDTIHWRVMALNGTGGLSEMSETRKVTYECEESQSKGDGSGESGGPNSERNQQKCKNYNVTMKITGPKNMACCDIAAFKATTQWDCKDKFGRSMISPVAWLWELEQNPADANNSILPGQDSKQCKVKCNCNLSQVVTLKLCVTFTDLVNGGMFKCCTDHRFFVDCDVLPKDKPWNYVTLSYAYPLSVSTHPDYRSTTIAPSNSMRGVAGTTTPAVLYPDVGGGDEDEGAPLGTVTTQKAVAVGPVVRTHQEIFPENPTSGTPNKCATVVPTGPTGGEIKESRVHLAFGCGLQVDNQKVKVKPSDLVGGATASNRRGLETYGNCSLQISPGCGLTVVSASSDCASDVGKVRIDRAGLLGDGLMEGDRCCEIQTYLGCGLKFGTDTYSNALTDAESGPVSTRPIEVNPSDLAGPGLETNGDCGLGVNYGCGLLIDSDVLQIKKTGLTMSDYFLAVDGTDALQVSTNPDTCYATVTLGLQRLYFLENDCGVLFGPHLESYQETEIELDLACVPTPPP